MRAKGGDQRRAGFDCAFPGETEWRYRRAAGFDGIEINATRHTAPLSIAYRCWKRCRRRSIFGAPIVSACTLRRSPDGRTRRQTRRGFLSPVAVRAVGRDRDWLIWRPVWRRVTPERGDLSTSAFGRCLRKSFSGIVIASGLYTPASAIAAVESRWADAIAFTLATGYGDQLIRAIRRPGSRLSSPAGRDWESIGRAAV